MPKFRGVSRPWLIILLLCAFLPVGVTLEIFGRTPSISFFDLAMIAAMFWLLVEVVLGDFRFFTGDHTLNVLIAIYLLANFFSLLFSLRDPLRSILEIKVIILGYLLYLLTLSVVFSTQDLWRLTTGLVFFGCAVSLLLLYSYYKIWSQALSGALTAHDILLVKSTVEISGGRSNYVASLLVPIFPLGIGILLSARGKSALIWLGACLVIATGILVTMSRGAMIGLAVGFIVAMPLLRRRLFNLKSLAVTLGLLTLFFFAVPRELLDANYYMFSGMFRSVDFNRIDLWETAWREFLNYPLLGVGPGCIYLYNAQFAINDIYSHNYILNSLADVGLFGTVPFVLMLSVLLRRAYQLAATTFVDPKRRSIGMGLFVGLVATLAHGLVEPTFVAQEYLAIFWTVMALITLYASASAGQDNTSPLLSRSQGQ